VNPTLLYATLVLAVPAATVITLTAWAWRDYRMHPERYGYRPAERDRGKRRRWLTRPQRGRTRQPVAHWTTRRTRR
jgi:hypothetical protein